MAGLIYLDANILIDAFFGEPLIRQASQSLLRALASKPMRAVTSELTLAEVLGRPEAERNTALKQAYHDLLMNRPLAKLLPVTRDILLGTPRLRAHHPTKLRLADAIHLESAIRAGCAVFASSDTGIRPPQGMVRMQPDRDGVDAILRAIA